MRAVLGSRAARVTNWIEDPIAVGNGRDLNRRSASAIFARIVCGEIGRRVFCDSAASGSVPANSTDCGGTTIGEPAGCGGCGIGLWTGSGLCFCGIVCAGASWASSDWGAGDDTVRGRVNSDPFGDCAWAATNATEKTSGVIAREPNFMSIFVELLDLRLLARGSECRLRFADAPASCQHIKLIDLKTDINHGRDVFFQ
jgi:hypothetical protein